ncbi:MAG: YcxB family protein [Lachnospiraceae bacterium]|nr:YcxB family protein [Lachnospiraceae bacterium]
MEVSFISKLRQEDMYEFNMYHAYHSTQGPIAIILGIISIAAAILTFGRVTMFYTIAYAVVGVLFFIYLPLTLKARSGRQIGTGSPLSGNIEYTLNEKGLTVKVELPEGAENSDNTASMTWDSVYKIVTTKNELLIFTSRMNAYVIPKRDMEGKLTDVKQVLTENVKDYRIKWTW